MKRKILTFIAICGILSCGKPDKQSIVIGASRSITGPLAVFEQIAFGPIYKMWVDEVNTGGGIYVKEYGKKLPIKTIVYDDESDVDKMTKNIEKLIVEDKVDLLFPPAGTTMLFAAAPVANKYKYLLVGAEGGASKIKEIISGLPYFFSLLNFSDHDQVPVLADIMAKAGVKTAAIVFISDVHGVEYSGAAVPELALKGINVSLVKSIPLGTKDISPIISEAKALNVDAFLCFAYPDENIVATKQAIELGFNPKVFLLGPGVNFEFFPGIFGAATEGLMGWGGWNAKSSQAHKEFADKLVKMYSKEVLDWWGHNIYYAGLQFLKQAIEKAGSLDNTKLQEVYVNSKFETLLGPTWFDEKHLLATECFSGQVSQWQKGIYEVIGPEDKATSKLIFPKPKWPGK
ncbi:MAG: amino acid ABC transporter substrate-binding protein [Spirochaetales bacterium]|nr:amino acid ABC transporter substrate-binding protein [Spirochaetales bacterium]